jgi:hypothetical protein
MPLLEVNNLHVQLQTQRGPAEAVRGIAAKRWASSANPAAASRSRCNR